MDDATPEFYDGLSPYYRLIFQDWNRSIERQASVLGGLIEQELETNSPRVLDCACGIGTQALGLAARGHVVTATDFSKAAIARAQLEANQRGLSISFRLADMLDLSELPEAGFDAVLIADNALPHFLNETDLFQALHQIALKLRPGGLFLATVRDYDEILKRRPAALAPTFFEDGELRRIYHQVWDWSTDRQYTAHLYLTYETGTGWYCRHFVSKYPALLRDELAAMLQKTGFAQARWIMPPDSAFYQPLILARRM